MSRQSNTRCTKKEWGKVLSNITQQMPANLNDHQLQQLSALLTHYAHIFDVHRNDLSRTNIQSHKIETCGSPIQQPVRQVPLPKRDEIKKLLTEMQEKDIIIPSKSSWASPIVLVPKKDGSVRFCIVYRKVNELTHKDAYPIPRVGDTLDTLTGSKCFQH